MTDPNKQSDAARKEPERPADEHEVKDLDVTADDAKTSKGGDVKGGLNYSKIVLE